MRRQYIPTRRQLYGGSGDSNLTGPTDSTDPTDLDFTPVVGVSGGEIVSRLPIGRLRDEQPDVFNMYILAVESFMKKNDSDWMSWFRISGIHGSPFLPFQYPEQSVVNPGFGYCTHHSVLFLAWHRPYLALMEQALSAEACNIALRYTNPADQQRWHGAAKKIRQPYWDWSDIKQQILPDIAQTQTIPVTRPGPDGAPTRANIPNPLQKYIVPDKYPIVRITGRIDIKVLLFKSTATELTGSCCAGYQKYQNSSDNPGRPGFSKYEIDISGVSFPVRSSSINRICYTDTARLLRLTDVGRRKQQTMDLFAITDYNRFQTQLETIHDTVHVTVGGSMGLIDFAAFDPIFWLHHTNVDRLMAMYQNVQPNTTMTPRPRSPTMVLGGDVNDTSTTPLYPFRHPNGVEWTSEDLQAYASIFKLGYSYPEVQPKQAAKRENGLNSTTPHSASRSDTVVQLNSLYAPDNAAEQTRREWSAVVFLDTTEFTESCRVEIFIATADNASDGLVGFAPIFIGKSGPNSINTHINATIPLTQALKDRGHGSLEPQDVVPTLKSELSWAIEKVGSAEPVPLEDIKSLKIAVYSREGSYGADKVPTKGSATVYGEITQGKQGGWSDGDAPILKGHLAEIERGKRKGRTHAVLKVE
ncbi:hypothetical protein FGG08_004844 [Glutinoglossum americanum]|uniref:tyrosinase n=1 Tax=Glutinoglossum americanum TaxID=1670608 RepID=A0A9P8HZL9_9PEZI|nr:hypothetical protein FGG08_004844 [Glutinoglossum americanum]